MSRESLSFGFGEVHEYDPTHNGINWRETFLARIAIEGFEAPPPVWVEGSEGAKFQLNQENYFIWLNETSDELDCLQIKNPKDGMVWTFFRDDFPPGEFDKLLEATTSQASLVHTLYPARSVQDLYEVQALGDLEDADPDMFNGTDDTFE